MNLQHLPRSPALFGIRSIIFLLLYNHTFCRFCTCSLFSRYIFGEKKQFCVSIFGCIPLGPTTHHVIGIRWQVINVPKTYFLSILRTYKCEHTYKIKLRVRKFNCSICPVLLRVLKMAKVGESRSLQLLERVTWFSYGKHHTQHFPMFTKKLIQFFNFLGFSKIFRNFLLFSYTFLNFLGFLECSRKF